MGTEVLNGSEEGISVSEENSLLLTPPVALEESGEGLPYAPVDWPNPGDVWSWRVGKRVSTVGYFVDRYLYAPKSINDAEMRRVSFASKLAVSRYVQLNFPNTDVNAFFASFTWKVPADSGALENGHVNGNDMTGIPTDEEIERSLFNSDPGGCKAGNKMCTSLVKRLEDSTVVPIIDCDICCNEPRFCRECCCILCCKSVDYAHGGYSYVKCEAVVEEGCVCAHLAHINCALRSYMAGKVGGSIGLDAEYYCRRCDAKVDLVPHVARLLETCESVESRDDVGKILTFGYSILRGSQRSEAKGLLIRIESANSKLYSGICLEDVWKIDDNLLNLPTAMEVAMEQELMEIETEMPEFSSDFNWEIESLKLEDEMNHVLQGLRRSQETEYKLAEDSLGEQKSYLSSLFQQLEIERAELNRHASPVGRSELLTDVTCRMEQIRREIAKFKHMGQVAGGFGKTPKDVLEKHFGLQI